jgi:hypothetical protein
MVLFINPKEKKFFFKFINTDENKGKVFGDANTISDLLNNKPSEISQWAYYGWVAVFMGNNVGAISPLNGWERIYAPDRIKLEKSLAIL